MAFDDVELVAENLLIMSAKLLEFDPIYCLFCYTDELLL
jgi:hypothetical protein